MGEWLDSGAPGRKSKDGLKASTLSGYRDLAARYIEPIIGQVRARDLTSDQVKRLYDGMTARGLSSRTVTYTATILNACLAWAVRSRKLALNAAEGLRLPHQAPVRDSGERLWSAKQRKDFLNGCRAEPLYAAFHLAAHTGLRRGEICGLRWSDVDLSAGVLTVVRNRVLVRVQQGEKHHVEIVDTTPKTGKGRRIDLDPATIEVLREHRLKQMAAAYGEDSPAAVDVFTDWSGGRLSPDSLSYRFELAVKASGLPYLSLHSLRHGWATLALQAGVPVQVVSKMLGHKNVNVTWNIYQHVIPSMTAEAAAKVAAL